MSHSTALNTPRFIESRIHFCHEKGHCLDIIGATKILKKIPRTHEMVTNTQSNHIMTHNITPTDSATISASALIRFWDSCPSIGRLNLTMRCFFVFILITSVTSAEMKPKMNSNMLTRKGMALRTPTWANASNRMNRSSSTIIVNPPVTVNSTGKIMTDVYGGIIDGVTDEVSKAMLDHVFLSQDYHNIARTVVSGVLSQAAKRSASAGKKLKSVGPVIPESLNETMASKISKTHDTFTSQVKTLLYKGCSKHDITPMKPHDDGDGQVKHGVKLFTAFVTRWVLLPAIVHTLAYYVPEISIHEFALWCKEHLGNTSN